MLVEPESVPKVVGQNSFELDPPKNGKLDRRRHRKVQRIEGFCADCDASAVEAIRRDG